MANNLDSNFTRKLMESFIKPFETTRVLSKNVNTQLFDGKFNGRTGDVIDVSRPTDYVSSRTPEGDISALNPSDIITGKATAIVQDYFTVEVDYQEADESLKMGNIDELLAPAAKRIVTDFEVDFGAFMMKNTALLAGDVGTSATTWDHIAQGGSILSASGVPADDQWTYAVNPFTQRKLASDQRGLGGETGSMTANQKATITENFAGMKVMTSTALASYTTGSGGDRAGTLSANPTVTYVAAKDTMTQVLAVTALQANLVVKAGETITITGRNRLNLSTRKPILDETGATILWSGTVTADVTLDGAGAGNLVVTGPAIFEAAGAYNTVDSAPVSGDVVTLGGAASKLIQPNLFWHKQAFSVTSVPIAKLHSTDTVATTADGLQLRVSKGTSIRENKQIIRFDFRPAFAVLNPFFAGQGYGF